LLATEKMRLAVSKYYFLKYLSILSKASLELIIDIGNPAPGTVEAPT
jgi:hypothetical protein